MVCPRCQKVRRFKELVERDPKNKKKRWLITSCISCDYHIDIEEYKPGKAVYEGE